MTVQLYHGDCLDVMASMEPNSVDAIVTDPPYGLAFMGKDWDHGVPGVHFWREALRVAKPGAHLLAFGGTRTFHRLAVAIEDAGWELRDTVCWLYGSGFPKSHDVSKAIDREAGAEREVVGRGAHCGLHHRGGNGSFTDDGWKAANRDGDYSIITAPATPAAQQWAGWGTALKPAWEPILVARKPLAGTVAGNVLAWGTGAINVDGCRIGTDDGEPPYTDRPQGVSSPDWVARGGMFREDRKGRTSTGSPSGRWPANVVHDGSDEVMAGFPVSTSNGGTKPNPTSIGGNGIYGGGKEQAYFHFGDTGSAARFFYCAKASRADRDEGLEGLEAQVASVGNLDAAGRDPTNAANYYGEGAKRRIENGETPTIARRNHHPTVKPTDLMRWLVRLVTPLGGVVLDPFMGSGSTGKAAVIEGMAFVGIEQDAEYLEIARRRIDAAQLPLLETI